MATIPRRLEFDLGQGWARGLSLVFATEAESAAVELGSALRVEQIHSDLVVDAGAHLRAPMGEASLLGRADGLIAAGDAFRDSRRVLLVKGADCAPLIYVDRESKQVAAIHAGWRGLAQGIHRVPFQRGFDPRTTWVWIGPCLNGDSFEVGADMWTQFPNHASDPTLFMPRRLDGSGGRAADGSERRYFQAWDFITRELQALKVEMVYNVEVDTFTDADFASYRRGLAEGRKLRQHNFAWVGWGKPSLRKTQIALQ